VHGSGGLLRADNQFATTVQKATGAGFNSDPVLNFFLERYTPAYRAELAEFVAAIRDDRPPSVGFADGRAAMVLAEAAIESVSTGRAVRTESAQGGQPSRAERSPNA